MKKIILSLFIVAFLLALIDGCGEDNVTKPPPSKDPLIDSLSKNHGEIGAIIDIFGKYFGSSKSSGYVEFTGVRAPESNVTLWSDTIITVIVPVNAKSGNLFVVVGTKTSNQVDFTIDSAASSEPYINNINPSSFQLGAKIEINGRNFGANQMANYVEFERGVRPAISDYISWSDVKIVLTAPNNIDSSGKLFVKVNDKKSNEADYNINGFPFIQDVSPDTVRQDEELTINGSGFGATQGTSSVYFGGFTGTEYSLWSDNKIIVKVPSNVNTDYVYIKRSDMKRSNRFYVKILP